MELTVFGGHGPDSPWFRHCAAGDGGTGALRRARRQRKAGPTSMSRRMRRAWGGARAEDVEERAGVRKVRRRRVCP
jgi:hypothetical protein